MLFLKALTTLWPFIKEMVLGNKSLPEAMKENKKKVALAFIITFSVGLNIFILPRIFTISKSYLELEKKHQLLEEKNKELTRSLFTKHPTKNVQPVVSSETASVPKVTIIGPRDKQPLVTEDERHQRYVSLQQHFEKIKQREEAESKKL